MFFSDDMLNNMVKNFNSYNGLYEENKTKDNPKSFYDFISEINDNLDKKYKDNSKIYNKSFNEYNEIIRQLDKVEIDNDSTERLKINLLLNKKKAEINNKMENISLNKEMYKSSEMANKIGLYLYAKNHHNSRSGWYNLFHPFKYFKEKSLLSKMEERLSNLGVTNDVISKFNQYINMRDDDKFEIVGISESGEFRKTDSIRTVNKNASIEYKKIKDIPFEDYGDPTELEKKYKDEIGTFDIDKILDFAKKGDNFEEDIDGLSLDYQEEIDSGNVEKFYAENEIESPNIKEEVNAKINIDLFNNEPVKYADVNDVVIENETNNIENDNEELYEKISDEEKFDKVIKADKELDGFVIDKNDNHFIDDNESLENNDMALDFMLSSKIDESLNSQKKNERKSQFIQIDDKNKKIDDIKIDND